MATFVSQCKKKALNRTRRVLAEHELLEAPEVPMVNLGQTRTVPFLNTEGKIGRNNPCPCGSGKKHKKCCGAN